VASVESDAASSTATLATPLFACAATATLPSTSVSDGPPFTVPAMGCTGPVSGASPSVRSITFTRAVTTGPTAEPSSHAITKPPAGSATTLTLRESWPERMVTVRPTELPSAAIRAA